MNAGGQQQTTITSGFSFYLSGYSFSVSLTGSSFGHPLNISFPWIVCSSSPFHTVLSCLEMAPLFSPLHCHPSAKEYSKSILSQVFLLSSAYISNYQPDIFSWMVHRHLRFSRCKTWFSSGALLPHQVAQAWEQESVLDSSIPLLIQHQVPTIPAFSYLPVLPTSFCLHRHLPSPFWDCSSLLPGLPTSGLHPSSS